MKKMKVLLVSNYRIEEGRGPLFRLLKMLPYLIKYCEVELYSFGPYDEQIKQEIKKCNLKNYEYEYISDGWFVLNNNEIAQNIKLISEKNNIDLVVLTWEIWDIAISLYKQLKGTNIKFLVTMHSIPFATALIKTRNYTLDCLYKFISEKNYMIKKYMLLKNYQAYIYMKKFNILTMTKTVEYKLKKYFKNLFLNVSYPGYAINVPKSKNNTEYKYDYVFMAKFEYGKGIYEFIKIVKESIKYNSNLKFAMVGSFTFEHEKNKFDKLVKKYKLNNNIIHLGWLEDAEKYKVIQQSKLFLYPSFIGDTFSQSLLEALACGKKVICYDVPFSKDNFNLDTVIRIKVFDNKTFAKIAYEELQSHNYYFVKSINFVKDNYSSWDKVALAEFRCYQNVIKNHIYVETTNGKIYNYIYKGQPCLIKIFYNKKEFKTLKKYYKFLKNKYIYNIHKFKMNSLIMDKVEGTTLIKTYSNFEKRIKVVSKLFYNWFKVIKYVRNYSNITYENIVKKQLKTLKKHPMDKELQMLYNRYKSFFYDHPLRGKRYLLHGDININNILCNKKDIKLIDASPIFGIKELELVKYIEDEIFIHNNAAVLSKILSEFKLLNIDVFELKKALFIDSCYRTFDSYLEHQSTEIINKGIKINNDLYEQFCKGE